MQDFFPKYNRERRHSSLEDETPEKIYYQGLIGISNHRQN